MGKLIRQISSLLKQVISQINRRRKAINQKLGGRFSPAQFGFFAVGISVLLMLIIFVLPPPLGVASDGSLSQTMSDSGLRYLEEDQNHQENDYFVQQYERVVPTYENMNIHILTVKLAEKLDDWITSNSIFDLRFLAFIYAIFYMPALWLLIKSATERVAFFSERAVVTILGILIFSDISYLTFFNSLYSEALIFLCILYCAAFGMSLQKEKKTNYAVIWLIVLSASVLCWTRQYLMLAGFIIAAFILFLWNLNKEAAWKGCVLMASVVLIFVSFGGYFFQQEDFYKTEKFHAMTRGVLLQAKEPEKALEEFHIDPSYTLLTDVSAYDVFLQADPEDESLNNEFYNHYSAVSIAGYYLRHPGSMLSMMDIAVKSSINLRKTDCGNYPYYAGMPPGARSIFWSMYSNFKIRSLPNTIGYFILLIAGYILLSGKGRLGKQNRQRRMRIFFSVMTMLSAIGIAESVYLIIRGGDVQLVQKGFLFGVILDLMLFFIITELLHKLNILERGDDLDE